MMLLASPTLPGAGLNPACAAYGSSVLILPDASLDAVQVDASLCTQGEISDALLYATVAVVGTHAVCGRSDDRTRAHRMGDRPGGVGPWPGEPPDDPTV